MTLIPSSRRNRRPRPETDQRQDMAQNTQVTADDLRQHIDKLPNVITLRNRLEQYRREGKLLKRLLKLASESEAASTPRKAVSHG